ncbi:MAG: TolC family protein [Candidatus Aminicenantes bacterium]|nr:TolC family protein [Candidatus Aminicenantes bacterium]
MVRRFIGILIILSWVTGMYSYDASEEEKNISLSLQDCIVKAMENNLGVAVEMLTPQAKEYGISLAKEKFLPSMSVDTQFTDQEQASYSFLDAAGVLKTNYNQFNLSINQQIPTGGSFSLSLDSSRYDTNRTGITVNPSYRSQLSFDFTQPLLKNFGTTMARREILIAQTNLGVSEQELKRALQETVYSVEEAYWNLVFAADNLKVARLSLKLAQDLLEKNKRAVEIGTMAPIEIVSAQAQVASREANILAAETAVKNNEDRLKLVINLNAEAPEADLLTIIPSDKPIYEDKEINLKEAVAFALQNRPDLKSSRLGLENYSLNLRYAKNQLLPSLDLRASYWSPGVSGDLLILNPDDPFGPPIGSIPGGRSDSFKDVFGLKFKNWSVGVTLDFPLNALVSRAAEAQARVDLEQALLRVKSQEQQIYTDLKIAVRDVATNFRRINALKTARELAEKQLEAEEEKLKVGLSTNFVVLTYQNELASAQSQEISAIIDYMLSLARLNRDMGTNLDDRNIRISQFLKQ